MVNKFLELLGVDLDEDFLLSGVLGNPFRFQMTDDFFTLIDTFGSDCWEYVSEMLTGKYEVIKLGGEEVIDMSLETLGGEEKEKTVIEWEEI